MYEWCRYLCAAPAPDPVTTFLGTYTHSLFTILFTNNLTSRMNKQTKKKEKKEITTKPKKEKKSLQKEQT